jgi:hypothetical protein
MDILEELKATLDGRVDDWSEEDRATALDVGKDLATFQGKLVAGQDVDEGELAIVKASARNLAAAATITGAVILMEFLERIAGKALALLNPVA